MSDLSSDARESQLATFKLTEFPSQTGLCIVWLNSNFAGHFKRATALGVVFSVGNRSSLLRATATFLRSGVFSAGSCGLLALLGGGLLCLIVVVVGSLGLSRTATFLASGLLLVTFVFASLNVVSRSKRRKIWDNRTKINLFVALDEHALVFLA